MPLNDVSLSSLYCDSYKFLFRPEKPACKARIKLAQERHKVLGFSKAHYEKKHARPQTSSMFKVALNIIFVMRLSCLEQQVKQVKLCRGKE